MKQGPPTKPLHADGAPPVVGSNSRRSSSRRRRSSRRRPGFTPTPHLRLFFNEPEPSQGSHYSQLSNFVDEIEHMAASSDEEVTRASTRETTRETRPSKALRSPYVVELPKKRTLSHYKRFRESGQSHVEMSGSGFYLTQEIFSTIEDYTKCLEAQEIDLYTVYWQHRLQQGYRLKDGVTAKHHIVLPLTFYTQLREEYLKFHQNDPTWGLANETLKYTKWEIPDDFINGWKGINTYRPWITGRYFIVVCHVSSSHWIVCRVNVQCWCIEVYDSHFHLYEGDKNIPLKQSRIIQCLPLSRLFSRLLESNLYYFTRINSDLPNFGTRFMDIQFAPREYQFTQEDSVSCGVYACMYMDLLLGNTKLYTGDEKLVVSRYRKKMASRIFMISRGWRDW